MRFPFSFCAALVVVTFTQMNAKKQVVTHGPFNMVE